MRELLSQYSNVILALFGGSVGIGLAILVFQLLQPMVSDVLGNLM